MGLTAASDEELALALKAGNESAFDELVRRYEGRVYAVAYRFTGNREDALDVAQEAFIKVYRKIGMWEPRSGFLPWLLRLTTNQSIDLLRRQKRRRTESLDAADGGGTEGSPGIRRSPGAAEGALDTGRQVRAKEIDARVQDALNVLSPSQRAVFVMRHYEGMQLAEIADVQGCTVGSVKVHLFRALRKMQSELRDLIEP